MAEGGRAGRLGTAAGRPDELLAVLGAGDGGEAAGGGGVAVLRRVGGQAFLCPFEHGAHAPAGGRPGGPHLALPSVEGGLFRCLAHAFGDDRVRILGPQPPGPRLVRLAERGGELTVTLRGHGETGEHGRTERTQRVVLVTYGELVQGPLPVAAGGRVAAQQQDGVPAAVAGEVPEDGQGQAAAVLVRADDVVGVEEVLFDPVERALEFRVEARVIEGAGLHAPVVTGVAQDALLQRGERVGSLRREGVQGPVSASSLEEAEKGTAGRYVGVEHEVSIRCGGLVGNGIFRYRLRGIFADRPGFKPFARHPGSP